MVRRVCPTEDYECLFSDPYLTFTITETIGVGLNRMDPIPPSVAQAGGKSADLMRASQVLYRLSYLARHLRAKTLFWFKGVKKSFKKNNSFGVQRINENFVLTADTSTSPALTENI